MLGDFTMLSENRAQDVLGLSNKRFQLLQLFYSGFKTEILLSDEEKRLMDDINLITPESIHLNAFMYEPLIDVSIWTLNDIYGRTIGLGVTP